MITTPIVPNDPKDLPRFLNEYLGETYSALQILAAGHIDMVNVAPAKPRTGDIRLADGTNWSPGSGVGLYVYYGSAWHFLG